MNFLGRELEDVKRRFERLYETIEKGQLTQADLYPRIQELRHRQDQMEAARLEAAERLEGREKEIEKLSQVTRHVKEMRDLLDGELAEKKAFVRSFVREIVVNKRGRAVIRYEIPSVPQGGGGMTDMETLALPRRVLAKVSGGGADVTVSRTHNAFELHLNLISGPAASPTATALPRPTGQHLAKRLVARA